MRPSRKVVFILLLVCFGFSSCSVTKSPIHRIYFPETVYESSEVSAEMVELAEGLTKQLRMTVDSRSDDLGLYAFVADWLGTPYRFGRNSRRGTDCSGFVHCLFNEVYEVNVPRTSSADLMAKYKKVSKNNLKEGDLVFFNINNRRGGRASHVGVYLKGDKFVHASTRRGVIISSLNEPYYRRSYIGGGRVK